jgi:predicted nucleotidyltransferase
MNRKSSETISWPPDRAVRMDLTGFEDAFRCSHLVRINTKPLLEIRVASLAGLAILKFSAWRDRDVGRDRDAIDLFLILFGGSRIRGWAELVGVSSSGS